MTNWEIITKNMKEAGLSHGNLSFCLFYSFVMARWGFLLTNCNLNRLLWCHIDYAAAGVVSNFGNVALNMIAPKSIKGLMASLTGSRNTDKATIHKELTGPELPSNFLCMKHTQEKKAYVCLDINALKAPQGGAIMLILYSAVKAMLMMLFLSLARGGQ